VGGVLWWRVWRVCSGGERGRCAVVESVESVQWWRVWTVCSGASVGGERGQWHMGMECAELTWCRSPAPCNCIRTFITSNGLVKRVAAMADADAIQKPSIPLLFCTTSRCLGCTCAHPTWLVPCSTAKPTDQETASSQNFKF